MAAVKDSLRNGKEIRFGKKGVLEERNFLEGHLHGTSYLFRTDNIVGRLTPKTWTSKDWLQFSNPSDASYLKAWLNQEAFSTIIFDHGRMRQITSGGKTHRFKISPDGRIFAIDYPGMTNTPLIDPEALWSLNADDLKHALEPGFGTCPKYSGPLGRFGRNYDHLLYKRESNIDKHLVKLKEMRDRFVEFCFPTELKDALGTLECPPQFPSSRAPKLCVLNYSDRAKIPYDPKYFKFELTQKKTPEEFLGYFYQAGFLAFMSKPSSDETTLKGPDGLSYLVKKTGRGVIYRVIDQAFRDAKSGQDTEWWLWRDIPGY